MRPEAFGLHRPDRLTIALATLAATTAGTVVAADVTRRFHRRLTRARAEEAVEVASPAEAIHLAGQATQDSLRVAREGYASATRQETVLLNLLGGFSITFLIARVSTNGIRSGWWPVGDFEVNDRHIHHYVPGILLAFASGAAALITDDLETETTLAVPFGVGVGLTFDEAALLLDFRDVYWSREGVLSVQLSLGLASLIAVSILGMRLLQRGEQRGESRGLIPDRGGALSEPGPDPAAANGAGARP